MTFTVGDKVQLKSGGQVMTVDNVVGDRLSVTWKDAQGQEQAEEYVAEMLKPAESAPE